MTGRSYYLSLIVGNTRLHWAQLEDDDKGQLMHRWDTSHLTTQQTGDGHPVSSILKDFLPAEIWEPMFRSMTSDTEGSHPSDENASAWPKAVPLVVASVVPEQTRLWGLVCPHATVLEARMCLAGLEQYPTLGVDRALSVRGAGEVFGWPVLVVDGGTALTFTRGAAEAGGAMKGGAILPGIRVQFEALRGRTALLPLVSLPPLPLARWAMATPPAIQSGVVYAAIATVEDFSRAFWQEEPQGTIVLTGGDAVWLYACLQERARQGNHAGWGPVPGAMDVETVRVQEGGGPRWVVDNHVAHVGMQWVVRQLTGNNKGPT